jgi:hypothetical protein
MEHDHARAARIAPSPPQMADDDVLRVSRFLDRVDAIENRRILIEILDGSRRIDDELERLLRPGGIHGERSTSAAASSSLSKEGTPRGRVAGDGRRIGVGRGDRPGEGRHGAGEHKQDEGVGGSWGSEN